MRCRPFVFTVASVGLMVGSASAQTAPPPETRWEVSIRVGGVAMGRSDSGAGSLPAAGENVFGTGPFSQIYTRAVPSWYFGDGQDLLSEVRLSTTGPLRSMDRMLTTSSARRPHAATWAAGVSRRVGGVRAELNVDLARTGPQFTDRALSEVTAATVWFENFFRTRTQLPGLFQSVVMSTRTLTRATGTEVVLTGLVHVDWTYGRDRLSLGAGAGVLLPAGDEAHVRLAGSYRVLSPVGEMAERDTVDVRITSRPAPVLALAGGWTRAISARVGLRADARVQVLLGGGGYRTTLDAVPDAESTGAGTVFILTGGGAPAYLSISSLPTFASSLSAPPVRNFTTFESRGVHARYSLGGGFYVRF